MRVGLDIDNVLCDSMDSFLRHINKKLGTNLTNRDITMWNFPVGATDLSKEIIEALENDSFTMSLPIASGAKEVVKMMQQEFDLVLLTHRNPATIISTYKWVCRNFGPLEVVHTNDKANHGVQVLVDDATQNIDSFLDAPGEGKVGIIFDQPWNQGYSRRGVVRCNTLTEVLQTLRGMARFLKAVEIVESE